MFRSILVVLVLLVATESRADFVLSGSEHLEVNSRHDRGDLRDSSTVDLPLGGSIGTVFVMDEACLRLLGGSVGKLYVQGSVEIFAGWSSRYTTLNVGSGGVIDIISGVFGRTTKVTGSAGVVNIYGGTFPGYSGPSVCFYASESISVNVFGGIFEGGVSVYDKSNVVISGGTFSYRLFAGGTSSLDISGGTFLNNLVVTGSSTVNLSGGDFPVLIVGDTSSVFFQGYDFEALDGLYFDGRRVLGSGTLIGKWEDGTPWAVGIPYIGSSATTWIMPGPFWDNGSGDSNWATAANWDPDGAPDAERHASIANGDKVLLDSPGQAAKSVFVRNGSALHIATSGELTVTEDMIVESSAKLEIDVSGSACGRPDVTGMLQLDATASLALDWVPAGPASKFGGDYVVATYGTRVGEFDTVGGGSEPYSISEAYVAGVDYVTGDKVTVSLHPLLDGDADLDGKVWLSDWGKLRMNFSNTGNGMTWTDGNFDPWIDDKVWLTDWSMLRQNFANVGYTVGEGATVAAVPEPSAFVLLTIAAVGLLAYVRWRQS